MLNRLSTFELGPSNATLSAILSLAIYIHKHDPLRIGSSFETPKYIQDKKAVINIKSRDKLCFLHCINANLNNFNRKKKYESSALPPISNLNLNLSKFDFPMTLGQLTKFEQNNSSYSVNVFGLDDETKEIITYYLTPNVKENHTNLLLLEKNGINHFLLIRNLGRLCARQLGHKHHVKYHCDRCLYFFKTKEKFENHLELCKKHNVCSVKFPDKDFLKFENYHKTLPVPFVIYADTECMLQKTDTTKVPKGSYQKHIPYSVGYYLKSRYEHLIKSRYLFFLGERAVDWFALKLIEIAQIVTEILRCTNVKLQMTPFEKIRHDSATSCFLCGEVFTESNYKVKHRNHLTGEFIGSVHNECNLTTRKRYIVPIFFHNLEKYDAKIIIKDIVRLVPGRFEVIAHTLENFICFSLYVKGTKVRLIFLDSLKFLSTKLETLGKMLHEDDKQIIRDMFGNNYDLVMNKLSFPYEYIDRMEVLSEKTLPDIEKFYSTLTGVQITESEYQNTKKIWETFHIASIGELSDLYLKIDVLLLTCCFESFRGTIIKTYCLDPAHYFTLPSLSWDAMLKMTKVQLELIKDMEKWNFIESAIRGGYCAVSKKLSVANNKYLKTFDETKPSIYILYWDVNSLYGGIMENSLPYRNFTWVDDPGNFDVSENTNDDIGFFVEVDLHVPASLHDRFKDYPPLLTHETINNQRK